MWWHVINPTAHVPAIWGCTLWRWRWGLTGRVTWWLCEGRLGLGAHLPQPSLRFHRQLVSPAQRLGMGVWGWGEPALAPWLACPSGHSALWARQEVARGTSSLCGDELLRLGPRSFLAARPSGRQSGSAVLVLRVRGMPKWGPVKDPMARALASLGCALLGRQKGAPEGTAHASVRSLQSQAVSLPRTSVLWACSPVRCTVALGAGVRTSDPSRTKQRMPLAAGIVPCWSRRRAPPEGPPCASLRGFGVGRSPSPNR